MSVMIRVVVVVDYGLVVNKSTVVVGSAITCIVIELGSLTGMNDYISSMQDIRAGGLRAVR